MTLIYLSLRQIFFHTTILESSRSHSAVSAAERDLEYSKEKKPVIGNLFEASFFFITSKNAICVYVDKSMRRLASCNIKHPFPVRYLFRTQTVGKVEAEM